MNEPNPRSHDAAIAAATVLIEEMFPHCPGGIAEAIHRRLYEVILAAIESAEHTRWKRLTEPSEN